MIYINTHVLTQFLCYHCVVLDQLTNSLQKLNNYFVNKGVVEKIRGFKG